MNAFYRAPRALPTGFFNTLRSLQCPASRYVLSVHIASQQMMLYERLPTAPGIDFGIMRTFRISTSRFGIGEISGSNCTPLGLHRIAHKIGGGWPVGAVYRSREMIGYTWNGLPGASITHRIFWLEGMEPGRNRGGNVDTLRRYIYIHGTGDEPTLSRPASHGCIHMAGLDLIPLFDWLPSGTMVWISKH